ncbi:inorganic phosphate transporter [Desulfonatronum parangueonense]
MWKILSGFFLGWSLGANDSANIFGTAVATGTVTYRTAIWLTAIFVMVGAVLEGPKCMQALTELSQLIPLDAFICALAAGLTMAGLTVLGMPASSSHAIVGAILGVALFRGSADFSGLTKIVTCWVLTPVSGLVFGYILLRLLTRLFNHLGLGMAIRNRIYFLGIIIAGCYGAYSLGANNVANVTGVYVGAGLLDPFGASLFGGVAIASGVLTFGHRVMMTVGKGIAPLDPLTAFVTVLAGAITLHLFTQVGIPVSSSQAVVGAVVGVGLVGGVHTVKGRNLVRIVLAWVATPVSAGLISLLLVVLL